MKRPKPAHLPLAASLAAALVACAAPGVMAQPRPAAGNPAPAAAIPKGPGSLNGIWHIDVYKSSARFLERDRVMKTATGALPPLQPWAAEVLEKRIKQSEGGDPWPNTLARCLPQGTPGMLLAGSAYPVQIIESPAQVTMLFEELTNYRVIPLNRTHPADVDPSYMGNSVGRWEGDTLVIDTIGLNDETTLDQVGMPHSDQMHVVERLRRVDKDTMEIRFTIDDPKAFTSTWETKATYKASPPQTLPGEYICENQRNARDDSGKMSFDLPGARPGR